MKKLLEKLGMHLFFGVIFFFMLSILIRMFTKNIVVETWGINNEITRWILTGVSTMDAFDEVTGELYSKVDWENLYPFTKETETSEINNSVSSKQTSIKAKYLSKVNQFENVVSDYCNEYLVGRVKFIEKAYSFEKILQWSLNPLKGENGITIKDDGYLTYVFGKIDVTDMVEHIVDLDNFLKEKDIPLLYVQAPSKNSSIHPNLPAGTIDYSNENMDELLRMLRNNQVDCIDFREFIEDEYENYEDAFYKTDHHWKTTTAFRAAQILVSQLNQNYEFSIDEELLSKEKFLVENYENYFLGSQGKKVTLAVAEPEDYQLLIPNYDTDFSINIPERDINLNGNFQDTLLDYRHLQKIDYYNENCYASFMNRNDAYGKIVNESEKVANKKIVIIKDSYSTPLVPYLALGVKEIDAIYEPLFTGSIRTYIEETEPDLVIVMYAPNSMSGDVSSHSSFYNLQ